MSAKRKPYVLVKDNPTKYRIRTQDEVDAFWLDAHGNKRCTTCKDFKPLAEFGNTKTGRYGKAYNCKDCYNKRARELHAQNRANCPKHKAMQREGYCRSTYGISSLEYDTKLQEQGGRCKICCIDITGKSAHLDHNHETGKLRDFLCTNCNRGLGHFKENKSFLERAINYLKEHDEQ